MQSVPEESFLLTGDGNLIDLVDCKGRWVKAVVDKKATGWLAPDAQCSI